MNYVFLYMKEKHVADIDDSIAVARDLLHKKRKELLKHALGSVICLVQPGVFT